MGDLLLRNVDAALMRDLGKAAARGGLTVESAAASLLASGLQAMREPEASVDAADIVRAARAHLPVDSTYLIRRDRDGVEETSPTEETVRAARELRSRASRPLLPDSTAAIRQDRER